MDSSRVALIVGFGGYHTAGVFVEKRNWPPYVPFPILHHDIAADIPEHTQQLQYHANRNEPARWNSGAHWRENGGAAHHGLNEWLPQGNCLTHILTLLPEKISEFFVADTTPRARFRCCLGFPTPAESQLHM